MDFHCIFCEKDFISQKQTISHLKKVHFVVDNSIPINCIVKNCLRSFNTFNGLNYHLKTFDHQNQNVCRVMGNSIINNFSRAFIHFLKAPPQVETVVQALDSFSLSDNFLESNGANVQKKVYQLYLLPSHFFHDFCLGFTE